MLFFRFLTCFLLLFSSWGTLTSQNPVRTGKDYAIFFYMTDFSDRRWPRLQETEQEAKSLADELQRNYGFSVDLVPNASKQQILDKITQVNTRKYGPDDQVLFFFSTHGYYDEKQDEGFLIPADGAYQDTYGDSWISYANLGRRITLNPSNHVLLALDACYSGAFGIRNKSRPGDTPWEGTGDCAEQAKRALAYNSRLYFSSGSKKERTPAKSLFASRWLETLRRGGDQGIIRSDDLRYYLGKIDNPAPEDGSFTNHQAYGDFIFVHKTSCAPAFTPPVDSTQYNQRQKDINAYSTIKNQPTISNCQAYLTDFPRGNFRHEVSEQLWQLQDEQEWQYATLKGTIAAYQNYLELYPKGLHANEARQRAKVTPIVKTPNNMIFVQGGTFEMGGVFGGGESDEKPTRQVTVNDFYLGRHEVTFEEYDAFCDATKQKKPSDEGWGRGNQSIINVSWEDAVAYCNWRSEQENLQKVYSIKGSTVTANWSANGYRLPTEAEWEYAARSRGKKEKWAGTSKESKLSSYANSTGEKDGHQHTSPVGSFRANDLGIYDMSGNVWEWCWDWYGTYSSATQTDPRGSSSGSVRVLRGGSWDSEPAVLRCAGRGYGTPGYGDRDVGFRLSRAAR